MYAIIFLCFIDEEFEKIHRDVSWGESLLRIGLPCSCSSSSLCALHGIESW